MPFGSEADPYWDAKNGVVYKVFLPSSHGNVGWKLKPYREGGEWHIDREPASAIDTMQKLALLHEAGGLPTEIMGLTQGLAVMAKQPYAEPTEAGMETRADAVAAMNGVQIGDPNLHGVRVFWSGGKAWFLGDLHGANIMRDASGQDRVMDALVAEVPQQMIYDNTHIARAVQQAREKAEGTQDDRQQILFSQPTQQYRV